jgi:hypothetical protein
VSSAPAGPADTRKERVRELKALRDQGLLSEADYQSQAREIVQQGRIG